MSGIYHLYSIGICTPLLKRILKMAITDSSWTKIENVQGSIAMIALDHLAFSENKLGIHSPQQMRWHASTEHHSRNVGPPLTYNVP